MRQHRGVVVARKGIVAASQPLAVTAGLDALQRGGNFADAALATSAVLAVVEPYASHLGGDAFIIVYDAKTGETTALNGSGAAPLAATPERFPNRHPAARPGRRLGARPGGRLVHAPCALGPAAYGRPARAGHRLCRKRLSGRLPHRPHLHRLRAVAARLSRDPAHPDRRRRSRTGSPVAPARSGLDPARDRRRRARRLLCRPHRRTVPEVQPSQWRAVRRRGFRRAPHRSSRSDPHRLSGPYGPRPAAASPRAISCSRS